MSVHEIKAQTPCGFCQGQPVYDAASWADGKPRQPAPCPRCGRTYQKPAGKAA